MFQKLHKINIKTDYEVYKDENKNHLKTKLNKKALITGCTVAQALCALWEPRVTF